MNREFAICEVESGCYLKEFCFTDSYVYQEHFSSNLRESIKVSVEVARSIVYLLGLKRPDRKLRIVGVTKVHPVKLT